MKHYRWLWILLAGSLVLGVGAQPPRGAGIDVILMIDSSKSMLKNDPQDLRKVGAKEFIDMVDAGDRIAIVDFGEQAEVLAPLTEIRDQATRETLKRTVDAIIADGNWTNIPAAAAEARHLLQQGGRAGHQQYAILLTDGETDLPGGTSQESSALDQLQRSTLPSFKSAEDVIYTVGLSREADVALMEAIANATRRPIGNKVKGFHAQTPTAQEVPRVYTRILAQMKDWQSVGDPQEAHAYPVDPSHDHRAIFTAEPNSGAKTVLETPSGQRLDAQTAAGDPAVQWSGEDGYDVINVTQPERGRYRVDFEGGDGRSQGYVDSDLWLWLAPAPAQVTQGEPVPLQAKLVEGQQEVTGADPRLQDAAVAAQLTLPDGRQSRIVLRDDGTQGDEAAGDGQFSGYFVASELEGNYRVRAGLHGRSFARYSDEQTFRVSGPPWVLLQTDQPSYNQGDAVVLLGQLTEHARFQGTPTFTTKVFPPDGHMDRLDLFDDGQHQDQSADDGLFANHYQNTGNAGVYGFLAEVGGPTTGGQARIARAYLAVAVGAPGIVIEPPTTDAGTRVVDERSAPIRLRAISGVNYDEQLAVTVVGITGVSADQMQVTVKHAGDEVTSFDLPAGATQPFEVLLETTHREKAAGQLRLGFTAQKTRVYIEPAEVVIDFQIAPPQPWWHFWLTLLALILALLLLAWLAAQLMKPSLMGHLEITHPEGRMDRVRLRNRGPFGLRRVLWMGTAPKSDIRLPPESGLAPRHARVYRRRIGGHHRLAIDPAADQRLQFLKHEDELELGNLRLRYDNYRDR